jgi:hypothetical protein
VSMLTRVSMLKRSILPRVRSEIRGWVTPNLARSLALSHAKVVTIVTLVQPKLDMNERRLDRSTADAELHSIVLCG